MERPKSSTFRFLGKTYALPFLKRTLMLEAQGIVILEDDETDTPLAEGFWKIECIIGERDTPEGQKQFCVVWEGDWPEDIKHEWVDADACSESDIDEFRAEVADLEVAARVTGARSQRSCKVPRDRIVLNPATQTQRNTVSPSSSFMDVDTNSDTFERNTIDNTSREANSMEEDLVEDSEEDADHESISMEEWLELEQFMVQGA